MDKELDHLKVELKKFEVEFFGKYARKPSKSDLLKYPDVKEQYEKYSTLKKSISENIVVKSACEKGFAVRKVMSPRNDCGNSKKSSINDGVWGSSLLKKNMVKPVKTKDNPQKENAEIAKTDKYDWRSKFRKNMSNQSFVKDLQSSVRKRAKAINLEEKLESSTLTVSKNQSELEDVVDSHLTTTFNNGEGVDSSCAPESKQVNCFQESRMSPFPVEFAKRRSVHKKSATLNTLEYDDLSDLRDLSKHDDSIDRLRKDASVLKDDNLTGCSVDINPCIESESFIEANFRDGETNTLQSLQQEATSFNYEDVCLLSASNPRTDKISPTGFDDSLDVSGSASTVCVTEKRVKASSCNKTIQNGNYRMLNMKKKIFCRKGNNGMFLRKQLFRQKLAKKGYSSKSVWKGKNGNSRRGNSNGWNKSGVRDKSEDKCFKCGGTGHWASQCKGFQGSANLESDSKDDENLESLEEVLENIDLINAAVDGEQVPEFLNESISLSVSEPFLDTEKDSDLTNNEDVMDALKMFKYTSFRPGQEKAIRRILKGRSTLLVLATGSGKSLCYQLPAYLYANKWKAITLVVSPLVSLMDDQVRGLPKMMKATRIHSGMTKEQREKALLEVEKGNIHVLLISPEAITSWAGMSPKYSPLSRLPPISFACIDECHCLSEWSHAFRPSYLRVCKVLKDQLGIKCIVGLTATATMDTCALVAKQLGINDPRDGIIAKIDIPDNLILSVSKDRYKDEALADLLVGDRFSQLDSVIVYCSRRDEAARVASLLRIKMLDIPALHKKEECDSSDETVSSLENSKKRKRNKSKKSSKRKVVTLDAECYHAGMSAAERRRIQSKFMNGSLRVVVATVAFGMGIDKHDVRSVIHYNMPMSFERYVQEVGRAGRDGKPAHCHVFLDPDGTDVSELSRHCYGKTIDRYIIKKFVRKVFVTCQCDDTDSVSPTPCNGHFASINIDETTQELDVKREGLETLLCYLENEDLIEVSLPTETHCTIQFYGGPRQMIKTVKRVRAVAAAMKLNQNTSDQTTLEFNAMKLADNMHMELPALKKMLRYLTYDTSLSSDKSEISKSGVEVQFSKLSFCVRSRKKVSDDFLDMATDFLHKRVVAQENKEVNQLGMCFETLKKFSHNNVGTCRDFLDEMQSTGLKDIITKYFRERHPVSDVERAVSFSSPEEELDLRASVRQFLSIYQHDLGNKLTGRAIARIFHGIDSVMYSAKIWGTVRRFWRSKLNIDFNLIRKIATQEILALRKLK